MRILYILSFVAAAVSFVLAIVAKLFFAKGLFGLLPSSYLAFTNTTLLFAIFLVLLYYLPVRKE